MCASALLQNGIPWIRQVISDLDFYMNDMPFQSIDSFKGRLSQQPITDPTAFERSNYIQILENKKFRWRRNLEHRKVVRSGDWDVAIGAENTDSYRTQRGLD